MARWLEGPALDDDVVISTRVRVARNISKYRFPSHMSVIDSDNLTDDVLKGMKDALHDNYRFIRIRDIPSREQMGFIDRKSTRLNSSHVRISYAVFCLK